MTRAFSRWLMARHLLGALAFGLASLPALADTPYPVSLQQVTDWKSVYGLVQPRREVPVRARLGGTLEMLDITEGQEVAAGQVPGRIVDVSLQSQRDNAQSELTRGEEPLARGVVTVRRFGLDDLRPGETDPREVVVQIGERHDIDGQPMVEILARLSAGDTVIGP